LNGDGSSQPDQKIETDALATAESEAARRNAREEARRESEGARARAGRRRGTSLSQSRRQHVGGPKREGLTLTKAKLVRATPQSADRVVVAR
jgi:hypothetical protein